MRQAQLEFYLYLKFLSLLFCLYLKFQCKFSNLTCKFSLQLSQILPLNQFRLHCDSLRFHLQLTQVSPSTHWNFTSSSLKLHLHLSQFSPSTHPDFPSNSFKFYLQLSQISLPIHSIFISLKFHFQLIEISPWTQSNFTSNLRKFHLELDSTPPATNTNNNFFIACFPRTSSIHRTGKISHKKCTFTLFDFHGQALRGSLCCFVLLITYRLHARKLPLACLGSTLRQEICNMSVSEMRQPMTVDFYNRPLWNLTVIIFFFVIVLAVVKGVLKRG